MSDIKGKKKISEKKGRWPKYIQPSEERKCPYCKKFVKNIEAHVKIKHIERLK